MKTYLIDMPKLLFGNGISKWHNSAQGAAIDKCAYERIAADVR